MLASEIRELTDDDIRARVAELEEERFRLRFRGATEALENPLRLRWIRRDVARLKTVLHERSLGAAAPAASGATKVAKARKGAPAAKARKVAAAKKATTAKKSGTSARAGSRASKR